MLIHSGQKILCQKILSDYIMVEKKRICGGFHFFMLECQNFAYKGDRPWKRLVAKSFGFEVSLNRKAPFLGPKIAI